MCMMKNVAMVVALVLALVCSQACAQKKLESASTNKTQANSKVVPTASLALSKKSKETKADVKEAESEKATTSKKPSAETKSASKSTSQDELSDEEQKKIKSMLRQTIKSFAAAELTDSQRQKADEVFGKAVKDYVVKRGKVAITDELQKKHASAVKELKTSGKSAREQAKEAFATAGFDDEQIKVFKATQTSLNRAKRDFGKSLTDEQIDCLPDQLQAIISGEEK